MDCMMMHLASFAARWYPIWVLYIVLLLPVLAAMAIAMSLLKAIAASARAFGRVMGDEHSGFPRFCREVRYLLSVEGWRERREFLCESERADAKAS